MFVCVCAVFVEVECCEEFQNEKQFTLRSAAYTPPLCDAALFSQNTPGRM